MNLEQFLSMDPLMMENLQTEVWDNLSNPYHNRYGYSGSNDFLDAV